MHPTDIETAPGAELLALQQVAFLAVPIVRDHLPVGVLAAHRRRWPSGTG